MPSLPIVNSQFWPFRVDQNALEDDVEIQRFARSVLEVPLEVSRRPD